jgi:hypothetical protein
LEDVTLQLCSQLRPTQMLFVNHLIFRACHEAAE